MHLVWVLRASAGAWIKHSSKPLQMASRHHGLFILPPSSNNCAKILHCGLHSQSLFTSVSPNSRQGCSASPLNIFEGVYHKFRISHTVAPSSKHQSFKTHAIPPSKKYANNATLITSQNCDTISAKRHQD